MPGREQDRSRHIGPEVSEARMLQRLIGCPRFSFSKDALWELSSLGMRRSFKSVQVCDEATMVNAALETATTFAKTKAVLDNVPQDDDIMLSLYPGK